MTADHRSHRPGGRLLLARWIVAGAIAAAGGWFLWRSEGPDSARGRIVADRIVVRSPIDGEIAISSTTGDHLDEGQRCALVRIQSDARARAAAGAELRRAEIRLAEAECELSILHSNIARLRKVADDRIERSAAISSFLRKSADIRSSIGADAEATHSVGADAALRLLNRRALSESEARDALFRLRRSRLENDLELLRLKIESLFPEGSTHADAAVEAVQSAVHASQLLESRLPGLRFAREAALQARALTESSTAEAGAPQPGTVVRVLARAGESVAARSEIAHLARDGSVHVMAPMEVRSDRPAPRPGDQVTIQASGCFFEGRIVGVGEDGGTVGADELRAASHREIRIRVDSPALRRRIDLLGCPATITIGSGMAARLVCWLQGGADR